MGCSLSTETKRVVLDPKKLKRTPSGNHFIFEIPVSELEMPGEKSHHRHEAPASTAENIGTTEDTESHLAHVQSWTSDDFLDAISADSQLQLENGEVETPTAAKPVAPALPPETQKFLDAALDAQRTILHYLSPEGEAEFNPNGKSGPVTLMVKPQTDDAFQVVMGYRSFGVDEVDLQQLLDALMDPEARSKFDSQTADGKMLKKGLIDEPERRMDLHYNAFKGMMNVGGRDAVFAILRQKINDNLWVISSKSVDVPEYPENGVLPGYVRTDVKFAGYAMSINPETKELTVTMYNQVDVKGNIPTWIVNKAQIPLRGSEGKFMFVTEIPRGVLARYELEPDTSDIANDPRGTAALKKLGTGPCFNYGFLPQTWSDPVDWHDKITGLKGDGDPLDLIEISGKHLKPGEVAQVQVLGAVCLIDEGAADWKLIGTACCKKLTEEEVAQEMKKVKAWMDGYKALFAKEPTQWYLDGMIFDRTVALDLIDQQNKVWLEKKGATASKATSKNFKVVTK
ncbi:hypothetical protein FOZ60_001959 [Perkinsus olseni]|uniref:inorganic diphosphatase n=1 Tax=Perkinsus olseni TaxID=32597 RepID=A0A7J6NZA3_PEROL|nr:hypothetical protein FOZ60_001959 [Perkinsus olseni]